MKIPIYTCSIDENDDLTGIYALSFVDNPANEVQGVMLAKSKYMHFKNDEKQNITSAILKPNQLIYRLDLDNNPYYIKFDSNTIEKIAYKMMKQGKGIYNTTFQHQKKLEGNYLVELWIIQDSSNDKSNALGFSNLPTGTLMATYHIENKELWKKIKDEKCYNFSLEGFFNQELVQMNKIIKKINKQNMKKTKKDTLLQKLGKFFLEIEDVEKINSTDSGDTVRIYQLADGSEFIVDADGYATIDGEQMPSGEHKLADGSIAIVTEDGKLEEVKAMDVTEDAPSEAVAPQVDEFAEEEEISSITIDGKDYELPKVVVDYVKSLEESKQEVENEVTAMKKVTPSTKPINLKANQTKMDKPLKKWELMAEALKNR